MLDPHTLKAAIRKVKDFQYTETEIKVREATNNDPWGTKSSLMQEIADATHNYEEYPRLFAMLWKRLTDINHVMHVQKALILIEYLLRNGADRFIRDAKQRSRDIQRLRKYRHYDSENVDDAKDARIKAKRVFELLTNDKLLQEERAKADKLKGMKITMGYGGDGGAGTYTSAPAVPPTGPGYAEPDRYASFTPADMGVGGGDEDGGKPKGKAPDFDGDDEEDGDPFKEADDPFGPPPEMTPGAGDGPSRPKKDKAAKETVAPVEKEKPTGDKVKKKKKKEKEGVKARPRAPSGDSEPEPAKPKPTKSASQSSDPFGDEDEEEMPSRATAVYAASVAAAAAAKGKSKSTIAAAFDDEPASGSGEVDLLTSPEDGVRSLSLETKSRPDPIWDFSEAPKEASKGGAGAKGADDPWDALTDVGSLGGKPTPKKEPVSSGRSMASMRGTQIDVSRDVFADFSAPPAGTGRGVPTGAVPVYGGGASPVFYQQGFAAGPAVYTSQGYATGPAYAPTAGTGAPGYYSPPAGSPVYMDPFASMAAAAAPPPASRQQKPASSTAFDGLSW